MMDDLISRQAAIDAIWEVRITPGGELFNAIKRAQEEFIKQLPSAEPERKKGIGTDTKFGIRLYHCSECKADLMQLSLTNFCPNCGVKMEGEA